jgi:hypothetical protein
VAIGRSATTVSGDAWPKFWAGQPRAAAAGRASKLAAPGEFLRFYLSDKGLPKASPFSIFPLNENCNRHEYIMQFLNKVMIGVQDTVGVKEALKVEVRDKDGNVLRRVRIE